MTPRDALLWGGLFASVGAVVDLKAQAAIDGRAFVPSNPTVEYSVDIAAMRECELWDGIERSPLGLILRMLDEPCGVGLADVDRIRGYPGGDADRERGNPIGRVIFEGADVIAPLGRPQTKVERVGDYEVIVDEAESWYEGDPTVWVAPKPGVVVLGSRHAVIPVLQGKGRAGVTPPELLSLSAGRGVLAHVVGAMQERESQMMLELVEAKLETVPKWCMARVCLVDPTGRGRERDGGEGEEPQVIVEVVARWQEAGSDAEALRKHLEGKIAELRQHPRLGALRQWYDAATLRADDRDLRLQVNLGTPRAAGGMLSLLAPFMMFASVSEGVVEEVVEVKDGAKVRD